MKHFDSSIMYHQQRFITKGASSIGTSWEENDDVSTSENTCSLLQQRAQGSHEFRKRPGFSSGLLPTFPRGKPSCLLEKFGGIKSSNPKMKFVLSSIFRPRFSNKSIHPQTKKSNFKVSMKCKDSSFSRWWFQIFFVFTPIEEDSHFD